MQPWVRLLYEELRWQFRLLFSQPRLMLQPLLFFLLVTLLFPLALGHSAQTLMPLAPGLVWVALLLAVFLTLPQMFATDFYDGTLALWVASDQPLTVYVLAKWTAHWVFFVVPLVLVSPWVATALYFDLDHFALLLSVLTLGSFAMVGIGAIGVSVLQQGQPHPFLLAVWVLPFYVPIIIFGAGSLALPQPSDGWIMGGLFLGGLVLLALLIVPSVTAYLLKLSLSQS